MNVPLVVVMRPFRALIFALCLASACSQEPTTPTGPSTSTTPPSTTPNATPPGPGQLQMVMPADSIDITTSAFGLVPYGYHGPDHAIDGHAGWDVELRFGSAVRAAADGRVLSIGPDATVPGRVTLRIETVLNRHFYSLVYGNLASVTDDVIEGASVRRGLPVGVAGIVTTLVGAQSLTYSMVHFQVDDFEYYREIPNPNAVGLELFLTTDAKAVFDRVWSTAWYPHELTEPFASNPRAVTFPLVRTWRRESGLGPMGITFTRRRLRDADYEYEILAESGTVIETGRAVLTFARPFARIDLIAPAGTRLGLYEIVDDRMRLSLGSPGAVRSINLSDASIYRTPRPPASN